MFHSAQATDYQDLLGDLIDLCSYPYVKSVVLNAAGTGYTVGDVLGVAGGTTHDVAAQIEVLTITGGGGTGPIGTARVYEAGSYTTNPSTTANAVTGGTGSSATFDLTMGGAGRHVSTAVVNNGGTGGTYVVGDILTVAGGTAALTATLEVLTVSAGQVLTAMVLNAGAYTADPTTTANAVTGGGGSGCTMDLTMAYTGWVTHRDETSGTIREWIGEAEGSGTDEIYLGIRTYDDGSSSYYNWELAGFTGFSGNNDWADQTGFSDKDTYTPIADNAATPVDYWLFINAYRITGVFNVGTVYNSMHVGFLNRYSTPGEYPYPLYIGGCSSDRAQVYSAGGEFRSGLCDPVAADNTSEGPHAIRFTDGQWYHLMNAYSNFGTKTKFTDRCVFPAGQGADPTGANYFAPVSGAFAKHLFPNDSATPEELHDTGGLSVLLPTIVLFGSPSEQVVGEMDGVFQLSAAGNGITPEDTITIGSDRYYCFQNCSRTDSHAYVAIRKD